jgi:hypothetical protein
MNNFSDFFPVVSGGSSSSSSGGGGGSRAITKEVNGVTYENVWTDPKEFGYPGPFISSVTHTNFGGNVAYGSNLNTTWSQDTGNYIGPNSWATNTDITVANVTNATDGGFLHCFVGPEFTSSYSIVIKITIDGTLYTWSYVHAGVYNGQFRPFIGAQYSTVPQGFHGSSYLAGSEIGSAGLTEAHYLPTAANAILMSAPKLYFENSCSVVFNYSSINASNDKEVAVAAITIL